MIKKMLEFHKLNRLNEDQIQIVDTIFTVQWFETFDKDVTYELIDKEGFCVNRPYIEDTQYFITWVLKEDDFGGTYMQCVTAAKVLNVTKDESYFQAIK